MSLYIYGVLDAKGLIMPEVPGIQDQSPRLLDVDDFRIIITDFTGTSLIPTKENVFAHERVVESVMDLSTPLPFRFGSVVSEEKLREFVVSNRALLQSDLQQVRGCVEMGIKVMPTVSEREPEIHPGTGTEFLHARQKRQAIQKETVAWVDAAVASTIRRSDVSTVEGTTRLLVRIAHLVPRTSFDEYKSRMDGLVLQRTDHHFLRSGPWPPYSFISTPYLR